MVKYLMPYRGVTLFLSAINFVWWISMLVHQMPHSSRYQALDKGEFDSGATLYITCIAASELIRLGRWVESQLVLAVVSIICMRCCDLWIFEHQIGPNCCRCYLFWVRIPKSNSYSQLTVKCNDVSNLQSSIGCSIFINCFWMYIGIFSNFSFDKLIMKMGNKV